MKKPLGRLTRLPLRDAWRHESGEFTPWIAEPDNLALLAEALGLEDLVCVATEAQVGDFKVDLLCTDGADQVIIENQLAPTNHGHLGQILTYAAGVGAKKVIWIAESFRPEHAAALQFLNENSALAARRAEIERGLGFDLEWQESPDAGRCRLASTLEDAPLEDESRWGEYLDWIVRRLVRMDDVLRSVVMSLP